MKLDLLRTIRARTVNMLCSWLHAARISSHGFVSHLYKIVGAFR